MAFIKEIQTPDNIKHKIKNTIIPVVGTQTASTGSWTGDIDLPELYDGLTIAYFLPWAGSGNATLNLTLNNGTTTGAINCYYNTGRLTTHFGKGSNIIMTYWSAGSIKIDGTATTNNRWITHADYNSNTWRNIQVNGTQVLATGTGTGALNFIDSDSTTFTYDGGIKIDATKVMQSNSTSSNYRAIMLGCEEISNATPYSTSSVTNKIYKTEKFQYNPSGGILKNSGHIYIKSDNLDRDGEAPTSDQTGKSLYFVDKDDNGVGRIYTVQRKTNNKKDLFITVYNASGTSNSIGIRILDDGTQSYYLSNPSAFRDALSNAAYVGTNEITDGEVIIADGTDGKLKSSGWTINKTVPENAVFTDTKNTAGSTNTSSKMFLIGATSQAANPQTYSSQYIRIQSASLVIGDTGTQGAITLYDGTSAQNRWGILRQASGVSSAVTHYLPVTGGTILNSSNYDSYAATITIFTKVGTPSPDVGQYYPVTLDPEALKFKISSKARILEFFYGNSNGENYSSLKIPVSILQSQNTTLVTFFLIGDKNQYHTYIRKRTYKITKNNNTTFTLEPNYDIDNDNYNHGTTTDLTTSTIGTSVKGTFTISQSDNSIVLCGPKIISYNAP